MMRKKIFFLFFLLGGLTVFSLFTPERFLSRQNVLVSTVIISRAGEEPLKTVFSLLDQIEQSKVLLKKSAPLKFTEIKNKLTKREIALAVLNIETDEIFEKRYWLDEEDIQKANKIRKNYLENTDNLPKFIPENPQDDFVVTSEWWNNWNSEWSIKKIGDDKVYKVLGVKFLVSSSDLPYFEDKTGERYSDIVYVPYSDFVHNKEIAELGKARMREWVAQAFEKLKNAKVESRSFPGQLVTETIDPKFVMQILINEHTDPKSIFNALDQEAKLKIAERVLVRYGLNGEETFRYTSSKTGALGPAQIMPRTYSNPRTGSGIVQAYLEANLIKDVDIGRVDMVNAIMAQILVFDDHLIPIIKKVKNSGSRAKQIFAKLSPDQLNEVRAMIYNGGPNKYNIATGGLNLKVKGAKETLGFIQKLRIIRDLKLFE